MTDVALTPADTRVSLELTKELVDTALETFFQAKIRQADIIDPQYGTLWKSALKLSQSGGKRLRPYITFLAYQSITKASVDPIIPIAAAQELLHLGLLVHDDVIDRDYIRYGTDNISGQYNTLYAPLIQDDSERRHFSDSAAILAGDVLMFGGHELIQSSQLPTDLVKIASEIYGRAIFTVAGGELLDTESAFRPYDSIDALSVARFKTAHYSFVTPLLMGARLAGANKATCTILEKFGENLGIAYQLVDDLLGVFGDEDITGKSTVSDIQEGKHTFLIEEFRVRASNIQLAEFENYFGHEMITQKHADIIRNLLIDSGAKKAVEDAIDSYRTLALNSLEGTHFDDVSKQTFIDLVYQATRRSF